ncbi:pyridoxamine 5'-phosphate oxidase family protein [Ruminococcaceae bacterium OttesenSCG-928-I18]|nr:pyridoxamine 5'-phosphate oxidase family protein [Ruminococcaceae bacterium OttesenSCG-928-I18]
MGVEMDAFWEELEKIAYVSLATSKDDIVTVRPVAAVRNGERILVRSNQPSRKIAQIAANANVALSFGYFYLQGRADLLGSCQSEENEANRDTYRKKFPEAFGKKDAYLEEDDVFISILPTRINQWIFKEETPTELAELLL